MAEAEARPPASLEDIFSHTFGTMPPRLAEELAALKAEGEGSR